MAKGFSFFWDTRVWVDMLFQRGPELKAINHLYLMAMEGRLIIYLSESAITTSLYVYQSAEIVRPMMRFLQVAKVLPISHRILEYALESDFGDKEDAILYQLALGHQVDYFVTLDKKNYPRRLQSLTQVLSPKEAARLI